LVNHHWNVAVHITSRGLATEALHAGPARSFTSPFVFVGPRLLIQCSDGGLETLPLVPRTVADFHAAVMQALARLGIEVRIWRMPVEIEDPIPFERDTVHREYDAVSVNAFWRALLSM